MGQLQIALSASLPPNVLYNLTVYDVNNVEAGNFTSPVANISNAESLGVTSDLHIYGGFFQRNFQCNTTKNR